MVRSTVSARPVTAAVIALLPAILAAGPAEARDNTFHDNVLQSGHVGADWRRHPTSSGLALTFDERDDLRDKAQRELRHHLKDFADGLPLPHITLFTDTTPARPDGQHEETMFGLFGDDLGVSRTVFGWELDARPFARMKADFSDAEARTGIRVRWGRGLRETSEPGDLRGFLYTDWEARGGLDGLFGGSRTTGGHDLDTGLALTFGGWSLAVEANLAGSGFSDREEDGAAGYLGYAIRF